MGEERRIPGRQRLRAEGTEVDKNHRDIGREGIQIQPAQEKQSWGAGGGGRKCRKRRERNITRAPSRAVREEEGTNPRPLCSSRPSFGFGGEPVARRWGAFCNSPLLSTIRAPSRPPHTYTWKSGGGGGAGVIRADRELSKGTQLSLSTHIHPPAGVSVYTQQIHLCSVEPLEYPVTLYTHQDWRRVIREGR